MTLSDKDEERFWAKVAIPADVMTGCWIWMAGKDRDGYGKFRLNGKTVKAHRIAYELVKGAIPEGLQVCHRCDVSCCVNPEHGFLGTNKDNVDDKVAKGRQARTRGEKHGLAKLTSAEVLAIRGDPRTQRQIAAEYQVSRGHISDIKRQKKWAHLPDGGSA